ncbi:helix-turn-helix domain-containing protein [Ornithinibacillus californiensis]|uniref:helix-turn-helix domain-containing protein n=1 Tax=Ornithinibacillus californiensis TaxID=161536 RepID=UPI00069CBFE0|nr:XRE family transcriptional regulator [Ornithinibacillus californiensis]
MLNSQLIGSYISKLRKEKDLTQVELAEQLNVSHQAVSKWEKGDSIPDVGTLITLADAFQTSVDDILNGGKQEKQIKNIGPIIHNVVNKETEKAANIVNKGESDVEDLISIAPVLKSSSLGSITKNIDNDKLSLEHITQLAPFLTEDALEELFNKISVDDAYEVKDIIHLAPFLKSELLTKLLMEKRDSLSISDIAHLGPFIGDEINDIIREIPLEDIRWEFLMGLAPFVHLEVLQGLVEKADMSQVTFSKIVAIAPFLDQETTDKIALRIHEEKVEAHHLAAIAPFVSKKALGEIAKSVELDDHTLTAIAPFLGQEALGKLIGEADLKKLSPSALASLAPFLSQETLIALISKIKS